MSSLYRSLSCWLTRVSQHYHHVLSIRSLASTIEHRRTPAMLAVVLAHKPGLSHDLYRETHSLVQGDWLDF